MTLPEPMSAVALLGLLDLTSLGEDDSPARIRALCAAARSRHGLPESVALVGDPSLNRGDAEADYPHGLLDARLSTAVDRVRAVLLGSALPPHTAPVRA